MVGGYGMYIFCGYEGRIFVRKRLRWECGMVGKGGREVMVEGEWDLVVVMIIMMMIMVVMMMMMVGMV